MNTKETILTLEMKAKLSALWIFVLLNMLFRDIHELGRPGMLTEMINSTVSAELFLVAAIFLQIPLGMVILSRLLPPHINRWANLIASPLLMVMIVINNLAPDMDDFFFAVIEVAALGFIFWTAWKWKVTHSESTAMA